LALLAYLAATSVCLAVILWNYGTKRIRVEVASMYSNLCPVFTVLTSIAFGVYPTSAHLLGGMLILSAIVWAQGSRGVSQPRLATQAVQGERHGG
jgi:drug/metabolite transporter (DMT)-like permease